MGNKGTFRPGRTLVLTTLVVGLSFGLTVFFSHSRLGTLDEKAMAISSNASPSIERLAETRGELVRLLADAHASVANGGPGGQAGQALRQAQRRLHERIGQYRALPDFPGEREHHVKVSAAMDAVDLAIDRAIISSVRGDAADARHTLVAELHPAIEQLDATLDGLVRFNSAHAGEAVAAIQQSRDSAARTALILGLVSTALAALATVMALRTLRAQGRLVDERNRLLAERASELESFAGRVAHDLRGPLAAMGLRVAAVRPDDPADVERLLGRLRDRMRGMRDLIDGLFEFATAGARKSGVADVAEVAEHTAQELEPEIAAARATLSIDCPRRVRAACTNGVLASVLSNLLRNAAKYIVDGEAADRWIALRVIEHGEALRFEVKDNGPGIQQSLQAHIFEPFVRGTSKQAGSGLGLSTVQRLVTAHGGSIGLDSEVGIGSTFWFELPRATS